MNTTDRIKELEDQVQQLKKEYAEEIKTKEKPFLWEAKDREVYTLIQGSTSLASYDYIGDELDLNAKDNHNHFQTKPQALIANTKLKLPRLLAKLFAEHCPDYEPDWEDFQAGKTYFHWNHKYNQLETYVDSNCQQIGLIYFPSRIAVKLRPELEQMIKGGEVEL